MGYPGQWYDREMEEIDRLEAEGQIDSVEASKQRRDLTRAYRDEAEEASRDAYERERERW